MQTPVSTGYADSVLGRVEKQKVCIWDMRTFEEEKK